MPAVSKSLSCVARRPLEAAGMATYRPANYGMAAIHRNSLFSSVPFIHVPISTIRSFDHFENVFAPVSTKVLLGSIDIPNRITVSDQVYLSENFSVGAFAQASIIRTPPNQCTPARASYQGTGTISMIMVHDAGRGRRTEGRSA